MTRWPGAWVVAVAVAALMVVPAAAESAGPRGQDPAPAPSAAPSSSGAAGQSGQAGDRLRLFLLTFGPGAAVWERFGHNALWIHDPVAGTDVAYHYGLFDMSERGFITRFLRGRMFYSMGDANAVRLLDAYRRAGRDATIQELRLTDGEIREMEAFLEWNLLPENRGYRYDYFRDNCSTRVRDVLDDALGGALSETLRARPTDITFRSEALSLTAEDVLLTAGMDVGLGPLADRDITRWELAFIPMRLRDDLRDVTVERDGVRVPLVSMERGLPARGGGDEAPGIREERIGVRVLWMTLVGLLLAALVAGLGWLASRPAGAGGRKAGRGGLAVAGALWGLVAGVLGLVLLALWLLTDHEFAHRNENLLQANPLALALVALVPLAVTGRATRAAVAVAGALLGLSLLGLALHPLPVTPQANLGVIGLALPVHLAVFWALWRQRPG